MSLVVVGSIAFDAVKTPFGERDRMLGGSAVHFSLAASFFTDVRVVGPVGDDFGEDEYGVLRGRGVATDDIERVEGGQTFFWRGECSSAKLAGLDSMNLWIENEHAALEQAIGMVDLLFLNDAEIRMFAQEPNLVRAARSMMAKGPGVIVAKQGEYGAALFAGDQFFSLPAYPLETVMDPTGAGDSFAGGFMGYLASRGPDAVSDAVELGRAMTYGSVLASFNVEEFGTERVARLTRDEVEERYSELRRMTSLG